MLKLNPRLAMLSQPGWELALWWRRHNRDADYSYRIGFSRCSCLTCIFASDNQMATLWAIAQEFVQMQAKYETMFATTVHRTRSVMERVFRGVPYEAVSPELVEMAMNRQYQGQIWVPPHQWQLPAGAFGEDKAGPT